MARVPTVRVLHVFGAMDRGGAEMRTMEVMRRLPPRIRFDFLTLSGRAGALEPEITELGGTVVPAKLDATLPFRMRAVVRELGTTIVHSHVHLTSGMILGMARAAGVPRRIAHFRSTTDDRGTHPVRESYRWAMRRLLDASATDILAVSEGVMLAGWSADWRRDARCQVVYNGIDPGPFETVGASVEVRAELNIPEEAALIVQVGRFDRVKNHAWSIEVLQHLDDPRVHLVFVGRGGTRDEDDVRRMVFARELRHRVHFLGERLDAPRILAAADASLLPSFHEGLPGVVLESLAAGTPVIASDLPGVREISERLPGVSICALSDAAAQWAATVARALDQRPDRASRAAASRRLRESVFALDVCAERLVNLWDPTPA